MARKKRTSAAWDKAVTRSAALGGISKTLDLGNALTLGAYNETIGDCKDKLDTYNSTLASVDTQLNTLQTTEKALAALTERMLEGVSVKFGKDSNEYETAGGIRKSERKRPVRKTQQAKAA